MVLAYVSYGGRYGFMPMLALTSARFHSTKLFRIFAKVTIVADVDAVRRRG